MNRLAVIILNYKTPQLTEDCLRSLAGEIEVGKDCVVVVDNGSADNSLTHLQNAIETNQWQSWVTLHHSAENLGFSGGNNFGIKTVEADAYLLLNSDTLVREGAISKMLAGLAQHPEAGIISPRLEWPDATPQISCFRYHSPISEFLDAARTGPLSKILHRYIVPIMVSNQPSRPDWTSFACVLIRRSAMERVGLMDEGYFLYFEDTDYCRRLRNAGWEIVNWPLARVVHLRGGSGQVKAATKAKKRRPKYFYASRTRYYAKFYGHLGLFRTNLLWEFGRGIALLREIFGKKDPHTCEKEALDIWVNWREPLNPEHRGIA